MTGIIDYGTGNLFSLQKALNRIHVPHVVSSDFAALEKCTHLILAGVGHYKYGMESLQESELDQFILKQVEAGIPLLGICLGMQLLGQFSEEGNVKGLGILDFSVERLHVEKPLKIPHIGWNSVIPVSPSRILPEQQEGVRYYFTHSYGALHAGANATGKTQYGSIDFISVVESSTVFGVQFHPEKSFDHGLDLLGKFCAL